MNISDLCIVKLLPTVAAQEVSASAHSGRSRHRFKPFVGKDVLVPTSGKVLGTIPTDPCIDNKGISTPCKQFFRKKCDLATTQGCEFIGSMAAIHNTVPCKYNFSKTV